MWVCSRARRLSGGLALADLSSTIGAEFAACPGATAPGTGRLLRRPVTGRHADRAGRGGRAHRGRARAASRPAAPTPGAVSGNTFGGTTRTTLGGPTRSALAGTA